MLMLNFLAWLRLSSLTLCPSLLINSAPVPRLQGVNNTFLVKSGDPLAIRYNDESVLENWHAGESESDQTVAQRLQQLTLAAA